MTVTDPVCGMPIDSHDAAATLEHQGTTYYFCSQKCQQRFAQDPKRYTAPATAKKGGHC